MVNETIECVVEHIFGDHKFSFLSRDSGGFALGYREILQVVFM